MPSYPAFPTLSILPKLKNQEQTQDPTLRDEMDNGMETTRAKFTRRRRSWTVTFAHLTAADYQTLSTFVQSTANYGASIFTFTDTRFTSGNVYTVRFSKLPPFEDEGWVGGGWAQGTTFEIREV